MNQALFDAILLRLREHGSSLLFAWGFLKALIPLPAPSVLTVAGAALAPESGGAGRVLPALALRAAAPAAAGILLGSYPYYRWAREGGWPAVERGGARLGLSPARLRRWKEAAARRRALFVLVLEALPVVPLVAGAAAAGLVDASAAEYAAWIAGGALVRCEVLAAEGWLLRENARALGWTERTWELIAAGVLAAALASLWARRRRRPRGLE